jgi:Zn-dependent protease
VTGHGRSGTMLLSGDPIRILFTIPVLMFSFSLHEFCHALAACALGDVTQKREGRLTLNPLKHIDWFGFICLIAAGFGWAKPVMVDPTYFTKSKKGGMALTSLAGPAANFIFAFLCLMILFPIFTNYFEIPPNFNIIFGGFDVILESGIPAQARFIILLLLLAIVYNLVLCAFNLIPLPPLDGSKIFFVFLPETAYFKFANGHPAMFIIMLILIFTGWIWYVMGPVLLALYSFFVFFARMFYAFML